MQIQYSSNNVVVKIPTAIADKDLYAKTILASSLSDSEKERLLVEAGLFDSVKNLVGMGVSIPENDFKALWKAHTQQGGSFTSNIIAWKKAVDSGKWTPQVVLSLLGGLASVGSAAARDLLAKNKPMIEAAARGNNAAAQKNFADFVKSLASSFSLLNSTKPATYTGATFDRQNSQYV